MNVDRGFRERGNKVVAGGGSGTKRGFLFLRIREPWRCLNTVGKFPPRRERLMIKERQEITDAF